MIFCLLWNKKFPVYANYEGHCNAADVVLSVVAVNVVAELLLLLLLFMLLHLLQLFFLLHH
jgi:hypothetical protein